MPSQARFWPTPKLPPWAGTKLRIAHGAGWIDLEEIAAALVVEGIEDPHETVVRCEESVADHLIAQHPFGLGIEEFGADVQVVATVKDANLAPFGRRLSVLRIRLPEIRSRFRLFPGRLVQPPIHVDVIAFLKTKRSNRRTLLSDGLSGRRRDPRDEHE